MYQHSNTNQRSVLASLRALVPRRHLQPCPLRCLPAARRRDAAAKAICYASAGAQALQAGPLPPLTAGGSSGNSLHPSALGSFDWSAADRWASR